MPTDFLSALVEFRERNIRYVLLGGLAVLMNRDETTPPLTTFGSWQDAEELRKWSFLRRTPRQRLDWLVQALSIAYQSGALKLPTGSGAAE